MEKSQKRQIGAGIVLQYLQMALNILISLVYTPIMLRKLGASEYGIYSIASSIITYLNILSLGFGASYIRFYSIYKKDNKEEEIKKLNGLFLIVFSIIALVSFIIGIVLAINVGWFYNDTYSSAEIRIAKILMVLLSFNLSFTFLASVFNAYITSQEKFIYQKLVNMCKTILIPLVSIGLLFYGYGSIGIVICTTVLSLVIDIINVFYCIKKLKMGISLKSPNWKLLKNIFAFSIFIAINQIIDQINWQTDKIILGKMINAVAVAIYAVASNLNAMFTNFSVAVSGVFAPRINMIVSKNEPDMDAQLTDLFIRVGRIQWFILAMILSGFIFFGKYFISRWAGADYGESYYIALLLMVPATIPLIQNIGIEIQRAKNKHQVRSIVYLVMAILNIGISIFFAYIWGTIGVALGTTISLFLANGIFMNIYYQKKLGINILKFWKSILSTLPAMIIPVVCGVCLNIFYTINSLFVFFLLVVAYALIYVVSILLLGLNKQEKQMLKSFVFRKKNKN